VATENGHYLVGELLSAAPGREWQTASKEARQEFEVKLLVGDAAVTVYFNSVAAGVQAVGPVKLRGQLTVRVVPILRNGKTGPWLKYIGTVPAAAAAA
jgi:hypothetical protein